MKPEERRKSWAEEIIERISTMEEELSEVRAENERLRGHLRDACQRGYGFMDAGDAEIDAIEVPEGHAEDSKIYFSF